MSRGVILRNFFKDFSFVEKIAVAVIAIALIVISVLIADILIIDNGPRKTTAPQESVRYRY